MGMHNTSDAWWVNDNPVDRATAEKFARLLREHGVTTYAELQAKLAGAPSPVDEEVDQAIPEPSPGPKPKLSMVDICRRLETAGVDIDTQKGHDALQEIIEEIRKED